MMAGEISLTVHKKAQPILGCVSIYFGHSVQRAIPP